MHRLTTAMAFLLGCAVACGLAGCAAPQSNGNAANANTAPTPAVSAAGAATPTPCPNSPFPVPSPPAADDTLSPCIPHAPVFSKTAFSGNPDQPGAGGMGAATAQPFFDEFSWRSFVALNWPADGTPIGQNADAPTIWEGYNESYQVFLEDGSKPSWGGGNLPQACQNLNAGQKVPVFRMLGKVSQQVAAFNSAHGGTVLDENGQPFKTGPLIDPHGQYARFAISVNQRTFDFIVDNNLYNREGQAAFKGDVNMPAGDNNSDEVGAVVIKTAWRVLQPGDKAERYHTIKALVYTPQTADPPVQAQCSVQTLGLVGFHIMHKTTAAPQWIWSTFEQVDNVRADPQANVPATFFDANNQQPINQPPAKPWDPTKPAAPSKLVRLVPIEQATQNLNGQWQGRFRRENPNSVWQFYQLISTQWPTNAKAGGFGAPAPPVLANITLETYTQRSSSCIACHKNATMTDGRPGDFSYLLQRAQPEKKQ